MNQLPYLRPWIRVALLIRSILSTSFDEDTWPTAKTVLARALAMRSQLAREGLVELKSIAYFCRNSCQIDHRVPLHRRNVHSNKCVSRWHMVCGPVGSRKLRAAVARRRDQRARFRAWLAQLWRRSNSF